jgi:hypothetical protein
LQTRLRQLSQLHKGRLNRRPNQFNRIPVVESNFAMSTSDQIALCSLVVAGLALVVSLIVALYTVWRSNKTASAGMFITLHDGLQRGWVRFLNATEDRKSYEFADLTNLMEISCALYLNRSLTGKPRELMRDYLIECLVQLSSNSDARSRLQILSNRPTTFAEIREFERRHRSSLSLLDPLFVS